MLQKEDFEDYKQIYFEFEYAIEDRLEYCKRAICKQLDLDINVFHDSYNRQLPEEYNDRGLIENQSEWQNEVVPEHFTRDICKKMCDEIQLETARLISHWFPNRDDVDEIEQNKGWIHLYVFDCKSLEYGITQG